MTAVAHAAEKLARQQADPLVKKLISLYKDGQKEMKFGKRFDEVYDLETLEPPPSWLGVYQSLYQELRELGIPLSESRR